MKKLIILSILMSIKVFAKEDGGSIEQNYDYGCIEENIKTSVGYLKSVLCLDEKLNKNTKLYLNKKLILEKPYAVRPVNLKVRYEADIEDLYVFKSDIIYDKRENWKNEEKFYLLDLVNAKFFEFGIKNCFLEQNTQLSGAMSIHANNRELIFSEENYFSFEYKNKELLFSPELKIESTNDIVDICGYEKENIIKNKNLKELKELFKTYVKELLINLNDPIIKSKETFSVYEKVAKKVKTDKYSKYLDEIKKIAYIKPEEGTLDPYSFESFRDNIENKLNIVKRINTPLGEVRFYQGIQNEVTIYDGKKEDKLLKSGLDIISITPYESNYNSRRKYAPYVWEYTPGYWDPEEGVMVIPGAFYVNPSKTLILAYTYARSVGNKTCGSEMFVLDLSKSKPLLTTFGGIDVCSIIKDVTFEGSDKAKIVIEPNIEFKYDAGRMTFPVEKSYEIIPGYFFPSLYEVNIYKSYFHESIKPEENTKGKLAYQIFSPYSHVENFPYEVLRRNVFLTQEGYIAQYKNSYTVIKDKETEIKLETGATEIKKIDLEGKYYTINVYDQKVKNETNCVSYSLFIDYSEEKAKYYKLEIKNACHVTNFDYIPEEKIIKLYTHQNSKSSYFKYINGKFILPEENDSYEVTGIKDKTNVVKVLKGKTAYKKYPPLISEIKLEELLGKKSK